MGEPLDLNKGRGFPTQQQGRAMRISGVGAGFILMGMAAAIQAVIVGKGKLSIDCAIIAVVCGILLILIDKFREWHRF